LGARLYISGKPEAMAHRQSHRVSDEDMMSDHIQHVTDESFDPDVLQSQIPVLVDYWAEWCGPCKMVAPILEEVAKDYSGRLKIAKLDIDSNDKMAARFGVRGIPTLMLFQDGAVTAQKVGALSKSQLTAFLDSHLAAGKRDPGAR
jgi:thioredoxin 1